MKRIFYIWCDDQRQAKVIQEQLLEEIPSAVDWKLSNGQIEIRAYCSDEYDATILFNRLVAEDWEFTFSQYEPV